MAVRKRTTFPASIRRLIRGHVHLFCAMFACCILLALYAIAHPSFRMESAKVYKGSIVQREASLPFNSRELNTFSLTIHTTLGPIHPYVYTIYSDDCAEKIFVNDFKVLGGPFCSFPDKQNLNLFSYLKPGENKIEVVLPNTRGAAAFDIRSSASDPLLLSLIAGILCSASWIAASFLWMTRKQTKRAPFETFEMFLCFLLVFSRIFSLISAFGTEVGWDYIFHIEMVEKIRFANPSAIGVFDLFYSYHPPFAFLLPRIFTTIGFSAREGIQLTACIASLIAFFFLRRTIASLGALKTVRGVSFLYIASTLPLQIYMSKSINGDIIVLACASAALFYSVRLFKDRNPKALDWPAIIGLNLCIAIGLFTKYNTVLLFSLPFLTAIILERRPLRAVPTIALSCVFAFALAFPYYHVRYFVPYGNYFPINSGTNVDQQCQKEARSVVARDPIRYIAEGFTPTVAHKAGPEYRDFSRHKFIDTWKDLWVRDTWNGRQTGLSRTMSILYFGISPFLVIAGVVLFFHTLLRGHKYDDWSAFGSVLIYFGLLHFFAMVIMSVRYPCGIASPTKALYISPIVWGISFFITYFYDWYSHMLLPHYRKKTNIVMAVLLAIFVILNHVLPVY